MTKLRIVLALALIVTGIVTISAANQMIEYLVFTWFVNLCVVLAGIVTLFTGVSIGFTIIQDHKDKLKEFFLHEE